MNLTPVLTSFGAVRFRFIAQDHPPEQILEAALDDFTLYDAALAAVDALPGLVAHADFALEPGAPNPFAASTTIRFSIPSTGRVQIRIHDVRGALVTTLFDRVTAPGPHEVIWDGRASDGRSVAAGVYFVELGLGNERRSAKILRTR